MGNGGRHILNEGNLYQLIQEAAARANMQTARVVLEDSSVTEQQVLLSHTAILIGVHGAGLSNALFTAHGAVLLEVFPYRFEDDRFKQVAQKSDRGYLAYHHANLTTTEMPFPDKYVPEEYDELKLEPDCYDIHFCYVNRRDSSFHVDLVKMSGLLQKAVRILQEVQQ